MYTSGVSSEGFDLISQRIELAQLWLVRCLTICWTIALGGSLGSFFNVVAWRIPRGRSINGSSHCPNCDIRLGLPDNLPIIGWLGAGGRCSNCQWTIPVRYFLVEVILGLIFPVFTYVQLLNGGVNLPLASPGSGQDLRQLLNAPPWNLIQLTVYHLWLICFLFALVLIKSERLKIPRRVWVTGLSFGIALPLLWPSMTLVKWRSGTQGWSVDRMMSHFSAEQITTILIGLAAGLALGFIAKLLLKTYDPEHPSVFQGAFVSEEVACFSLVGIYLGWQSILSVGLLALLVRFLTLRFQARVTIFSLSSCVLIGTLTHLFCWNLMDLCQYWPSPNSSMLTAMIALIFFLLLSHLGALVSKRLINT